MRACIQITIKIDDKLNLLKRYAQSFDEAGTYPDYDDDWRETGREREICQLCRVGDKSRPTIALLARRVEINIPNRRRRGFLFISPYQRFNLPCDSFAAERLSRRGAAPSLDAASVDPLIHGRDLQARAMLLHAMHRHNAHGCPLSLLRRIIGRTFNDTRNVSVG